MRIYPSHFTATDRTPFTYFLRHKVTKFMYYGCKTAKGCRPEDLWSVYFTSSNEIRKIIKTEGKAAFECKIARVFQSINSCKDHETKFLTRVDAANNPIWYNRHNGGKNFSTAGKPLSESAKKKKAIYMANQVWVTNSLIEKSIPKEQLLVFINDGFVRGRLPQSNITKEKLSKAFRGRTASTITKQRMSNSQKGKSKPPLKPEYCKQRSKARMGHFVSEATKQKQSKSMMGHEVSKETRKKISDTRKLKFGLNKKEDS
jgi:hypothetical protein